MNLKKKLIILSIFVFFISIWGVYSVLDFHNADNPIVNFQNTNETDASGCCSVVLQLENNSSIMSYRRDANLTADIHIEQVNWHGKEAIKQYKVDNGYFNHIIITSDGWIIGLGGIDDGIDNQRCENITATMINDDYNISKEKLEEIQAIKMDYKKGHVLIKAPNGNYGFATPQKIKTGHLDPGQYISMPNHYDFSRAGNVSLDSPDKIEVMCDLARSDMYGLSRRGIMIYDVHINGNNNTTDIYVSNDDGSLYGMATLGYIDDIYYNNTVIRGDEIPVAPDYKYIESISFVHDDSLLDNLFVLLFIIGFVFFAAILFIAIYQLIRWIRYGKRR